MPKRLRYEFCDEGFLERLAGLHLIAKRLSAQHAPGVRRSHRMGDGLEFADHRDYAPGDDLRFLDWAYYARMKKLLLRLFHEHSESDVAILVDCSASMAPGGAKEKFNYARMAAAAMAFIAMGSLQRVIVAPVGADLGDPLRTGRNRGQILEVLRFLAGMASSGRTDLLACAKSFSRRLAGAGTVVLVSDLLDSIGSLGDGLAHLSRGNRDVIILHVYSPSDAAPELHGPMLLEASETHRRMSLNVTQDLRQAYQRTWTEFERQCRQFCLRRGATYVPAPTNLPFDRLVLGALRQAGVLAE